MFNVVVVVLFLIALGLLWKTREHLAPTQHILAPLGDIETGYQTYTTEQQDKIWRSLSEGSRNFMIAPYMPRSDDDARYTSDDIYKYAKRDASWIIANFYKDVYAPAKSPITASDVDAWLKKNAMESYPQYRAMLESYFIQGSQTSEPATPSTPQPAADQNTNASTSQPAATTPSPAAPTLQPVSESKTIDIKTPTTITINVGT